jgi:hypothetical protein
MVIKDILNEELRNSIRMKDRYENELSKLPVGSLVVRNIKGNKYAYRVYRDNGKFVAEYKGRLSEIPKEEIAKWSGVKKKRASYRNSLSRLKKEISFLRKALRGKE